MKREVSVLIVVFTLLVIAFYILLNISYKKQVDSILNKEQKQLQISYDAVSNMYNIVLNTIVRKQILTLEVMQILKSIYHVNSQEIPILRGKLYRQLWELYDEELIPLNINQLQFHLKNGKSFLRFSDPEKSDDELFEIRKTIRKANQELVESSGFEGGRTSPGFRHVYPIVDDEGTHLGSVELSLSFDAIKKELSKLLSYMNFNFIIKRSISTDIVLQEYIERFSSTKISENYVTENPHIVELNNGDKSIKMMDIISHYITKNSKNRSEIVEKLEIGKQFYTIIKKDKTTYVMHFLPIYDTDKKLVAYIIGSEKNDNIKSIINQKDLYLAIGIIGILVFIFFLFLHLKNIKKILFQKNEIQTIAQTVKSGLMVIDKKGMATFINDAACEMLNYNISDLLNKAIHNKVHHHHHNEENCPIINVGISGISYVGEEKFMKKNGEIFPVNVSCAPLKKNNQITGTVMVFRDITEEKKNEQKIKRLAYYDFLTHLPNRKLFYDRLQRAVIKSKRHNHYGGFIYIDLDDFKNVNDTYGHIVGDNLLIKVAKRLTSHVRKEDTIARMGGDEFTIIIDILDANKNKSHEILSLIISKIHEAFSEIFIVEGKEIKCKVSIGGLVFKNSNFITANMILEKADSTMYKAKKEGKNRYKISTLDI